MADEKRIEATLDGVERWWLGRLVNGASWSGKTEQKAWAYLDEALATEDLPEGFNSEKALVEKVAGVSISLQVAHAKALLEKLTGPQNCLSARKLRRLRWEVDARLADKTADGLRAEVKKERHHYEIALSPQDRWWMLVATNQLTLFRPDDHADLEIFDACLRPGSVSDDSDEQEDGCVLLLPRRVYEKLTNWLDVAPLSGSLMKGAKGALAALRDAQELAVLPPEPAAPAAEATEAPPAPLVEAAA